MGKKSRIAVSKASQPFHASRRCTAPFLFLRIGRDPPVFRGFLQQLDSVVPFLILMCQVPPLKKLKIRVGPIGCKRLDPSCGENNVNGDVAKEFEVEYARADDMCSRYSPTAS